MSECIRTQRGRKGSGGIACPLDGTGAGVVTEGPLHEDLRKGVPPIESPTLPGEAEKNSSQEHWMDCIFCRIAEKRLPAKIVYEDDSVVAFEDINPQAPVHVLVIPRKHIPTSLDLEEEDNVLVGRLFQAANRIARQKGIADRGFRIVTNCNKDAGQTVFHIHIHLMGGRPMGWPPG